MSTTRPAQPRRQSVVGPAGRRCASSERASRTGLCAGYAEHSRRYARLQASTFALGATYRPSTSTKRAWEPQRRRRHRARMRQRVLRGSGFFGRTKKKMQMDGRERDGSTGRPPRQQTRRAAAGPQGAAQCSWAAGLLMHSPRQIAGAGAIALCDRGVVWERAPLLAVRLPRGQLRRPASGRTKAPVAPRGPCPPHTLFSPGTSDARGRSWWERNAMRVDGGLRSHETGVGSNRPSRWTRVMA